MILFHGSNMVVAKPRLLEKQRQLDFGPGFYTTTNVDQASSFAKKVSRWGSYKAIVNMYEIDENRLTNLSVLKFDEPGEAWLDFVAANRDGVYKGPQYDLIIGPVANDDVYNVLQGYFSDPAHLHKDIILQDLKIKKLYNQYVFASTASISLLSFVGSYEV